MNKTVGKKMTNESTYGEIYNSTFTQYAFCGTHKYFIILLDGRILFVSYFALQKLFDDFNHFTTLFQYKTDEKVSSTARTKFVNTQFVP